MFLQGSLTPKSTWKIGLVTSRFNHEITEVLEAGAFERLLELGLKPEQLIRTRVPGAVEIPLVARTLIDRGCDAVVALGAVIRGETTHYESVCQAVERGCTQVMLETKKPVVFGVLTTENEDQARDRIGGAHGHKGRDAAEVAVEMLNLLNDI
jgi:6,7-dimethyl-8-ribityllumazine synthase